MLENKIYCQILTLLLVTLLVSLFILNYTPPVSRDALVHHLAIPKLYLNYGGIYEIPELIFSYYPMNLDLLYLGALYMGSDILPKYIHMFFAFATALLVFNHLKRRISIDYALLGAIFFLSIPIIIKLSITVYVDLGLVFFSTASFLLLIRWIEKPDNYRFLVFAGICCGLGIGTKYNGLLVLFLITLLIPIYLNRSSDQNHVSAVTAFRTSLIFLFCALLAASPWLIRNFIWTGNPIYPLYNGLFPSATLTFEETSTVGNSIRGVFATRHALYGENIWQLLLLPVRIFFEGMDDNPRYFDGRLNPFLLILSLFAFFQKPRHSKKIVLEKRIMVVFCLLYFLFSFNTTALRIRYLAPIIPFLVVLSMYGLSNIESLLLNSVKNRYFTSGILLSSITLMLAINLNYIHTQFTVIAPFDYINNRISRDDYISRYRPEYKVIQYANTNLPESAEILCLFLGWRGYYFDRPVHFDYGRNTQSFLASLGEPKVTEKVVIARLEMKNISHMLIRTDLFSQWLQEMKPSRIGLWTEIRRNYIQPVATYQNYTLYKIK